MDKSSTIISDSNFGKRLSQIKKHGALVLSYAGKNLPVTGQITIGREPENTIHIEDSMVSRYHALVQKIKNAYFIKDLDSTNGTFVNGHEIPKGSYVKLNKSDIIRIGRTDIVIQ
ncbi:MAG: FHA domain-containing protein [Spirochaetales bacterium]|nr:FHA domain-containing protein [Spirochaetales bacterium]